MTKPKKKPSVAPTPNKTVREEVERLEMALNEMRTTMSALLANYATLANKVTDLELKAERRASYFKHLFG